MRISPWKSVSPACSIRLVMPEGPGDLSGCNFLISCLSCSGVNGVINTGCVVVVAVEACSCILGRSLTTSCALFSSWVLEKVMAQGESKVVPVEGVEGRGSCYPDSFVWRRIRASRRGQ